MFGVYVSKITSTRTAKRVSPSWSGETTDCPGPGRCRNAEDDDQLLNVPSPAGCSPSLVGSSVTRPLRYSQAVPQAISHSKFVVHEREQASSVGRELRYTFGCSVLGRRRDRLCEPKSRRDLAPRNPAEYRTGAGVSKIKREPSFQRPYGPYV